MTARWSEAERERLAALYGSSDIHEVTAALNAEFGRARSEQAVYVKASQMGLHRAVLSRNGDRHRRCERPVRWSCEPEMEAFMLEHDKGSVPAIQAKFRERFGFTLSTAQVSSFRMSHGTQSKPGTGGRRNWGRPIGYERDTGKGYVVVKVAERPRVPGSKDNWRPKHHLVWERANGRPVPEGCEIVFADRDHSNYDPANLVAVDKGLVGILNLSSSPDWHNAETLRACIAWAELHRAVIEAECRPRRCALCGAEFSPAVHDTGHAGQRTCPSCLAAGRKASRWDREDGAA